MSGPQCCQNPPTLSSTSGAGDIQDIGGFTSYISGSPDSKSAVLLISDVFGFEAPKLSTCVGHSYFSLVDMSPAWKLADKVAASGFYVVVPDFFNGDPFLYENTDRPVFVWLEDHLPEKGCEDARKVISAIKGKGVSAIGAAGFCWGGMVVSKLAKYDDIQAGVLLHPGSLSIDDVNEVKIPIAILGAESDYISPAEELKQFGKILSAKPIDSYLKIFPGVVHGWTVRYKDEDEFAVNSAQEAHSDMINWLAEYVK